MTKKEVQEWILKNYESHTVVQAVEATDRSDQTIRVYASQLGVSMKRPERKKKTYQDVSWKPLSEIDLKQKIVRNGKVEYVSRRVY